MEDDEGIPIDPPAWEEAASLAPPHERSRLRVITWNIWFQNHFMEIRFDAIMRTILARNPDIVCLQEVVPRVASAIRSSVIVGATFDISPNDVSPYGCLILTRKELRAGFRVVDFRDTNMGRYLLTAVLNPESGDVESAWRAGAVGTVHLESLNEAGTRRRQLETCAHELRKYRNAILCGDFNFDDTQEWGDWRRRGPGGTDNPSPARPVGELENKVLSEILPTMVDQWPALRPSERGATFDGQSNPGCVRDPGEVMRYDRVLLQSSASFPPTLFNCWGRTQLTTPHEGHSWVGRSIKLLGTDAIDYAEDAESASAEAAEQRAHSGRRRFALKPSDHYGLEFDCTARTAL